MVMSALTGTTGSMPTFWTTNRLWLRSYADTNTLAALDSADLQCTPVQIDLEHDGICYNYIAAEDGHKLLLHSRHDPLGQARHQIGRWLEHDKIATDGLLVLVGMAAGFHIQALLEHLRPGATLLVLDPDPAAVRAVASVRDLSCCLPPAGVKLVIAVHQDVYDLSARFREQFDDFPRLQLAIWTPPGLQRAGNQRLQVLHQRLLEVSRRIVMDRSTTAALSASWLENGIRNLPKLLQNPGVQVLDQAFAGCPALVIAAGPTLNHSIELARTYAERAVIIAVGTAVKPLLAAGITPHFIVIVDGAAISQRQIDGVPPLPSYLVSCGNLYPPILANFAHQMFVFHMGGLAELNEWVSQQQVQWGPLRTGGTVTLTALDLALLLGCQPIMALGLDLAFTADGTSHARQSMYDGNRYNPQTLIAVPGNYEPTVLTSRQFAVYIEFLSDYALQVRQHRDQTLINVNTGGAALHGFELLSPAAAAARLANAPILPVWAKLQQCHDAGAQLSATTIGQQWHTAQQQLAQVQQRAAEILQLCRHAGDAHWQQLQALEQQLELDKGAAVLIGGALRYTSMQVLANAEEIADNPEKLKQVSEFLYHEICLAAKWLQQLMHNSFLEVEQSAAMVGQQ